MSRTYTEAERDAAVTLALQVGDEEAGKQLGIPRRTVSSWHHRPAQAVVIAKTRQDFAAQYAEAEAKALERVLKILSDPKSRPRDIIDAGEWVSKQRTLLSGQATERSENVNVNVDYPAITYEQRANLLAWIEEMESKTDAEIAAGMPEIEAMVQDGILPAVRELESGG